MKFKIERQDPEYFKATCYHLDEIAYTNKIVYELNNMNLSSLLEFMRGRWEEDAFEDIERLFNMLPNLQSAYIKDDGSVTAVSPRN